MFENVANVLEVSCVGEVVAGEPNHNGVGIVKLSVVRCRVVFSQRVFNFANGFVMNFWLCSRLKELGGMKGQKVLRKLPLEGMPERDFNFPEGVDLSHFLEPLLIILVNVVFECVVGRGHVLEKLL